MKKITVMVTGVGGGGHGEQIFKALRLADTDYEIIAGDMSPHSQALFEADFAYILPPANDTNYLSALLKVCGKHRVAALFHGSEPELKVMSAHRDRIQSQKILLPINPARVIELCMDKVRTCDFLTANGFHVSHYKRISSVGDLEDFRYLPAVLKPSIGGGGSANVFLAQTSQELLSFAKHMLTLYSEFIIQEYVGSFDTEFTVGVLISMDGELINSIAVKRNILTALSNRIKVPNRTGHPELGTLLALSSGVSQGVVGRFPEVTEPCERIAEALGARGAINIQCRFVDGKVYVFEINPRFSGTTSLRAMVGYNEPDVLIRKHLLGENIPSHFSYHTGLITRGLSEVLMEQRDFAIASAL
ncbi:MAG: ATP-grasp domain-containing protein [Acidobacteriota bacterium]